jgi:hypothetical protein
VFCGVQYLLAVAATVPGGMLTDRLLPLRMDPLGVVIEELRMRLFSAACLLHRKG